MNRKRKLILGLLLIVGSGAIVAAQEVKRPPLQVPDAVAEPAKFAPAGWRVDEGALQQADLNGDGRADAAVVISHGGLGDAEAVYVKHVLVLALRETDGKLHRSVVSDAAVLDGDEGGAFGDPFDSLSIDRGAVVISHYGGSRDRWGFTHRYRHQHNQWMLIGLSMGNQDALNLEHYDDQDINLSTGLVDAKEKGDPEGRSKKPEISGSYYELEVLPVDQAPRVDGAVANGEWPGYTVRLNDKYQVVRNRALWHGASDLAAQVHAVRFGGDLYLCVEVTDNEVTGGDMVRLVTKRGLVIKATETKMTPGGAGYVFEARYSLKAIVKATDPGNEYAPEMLADIVNPEHQYGDFSGMQLQASVEIVDVDNSAPKARGVLSTRTFGSPYIGAIRIYRKGTLVLASDYEQQ